MARIQSGVRLMSDVSLMSGVSLMEVVASVALLALLSTLALPGLIRDREEAQVREQTTRLLRAFNLARAEAVIRGTNVTLCPSRHGMHCQGHWQEGVLVFSDANANRLLDGSDQRLLQVPATSDLWLRFASFPNRQYLQYSAQGFTRGQNGSLTVCPGSADARLARQIIFTQSGRARLATDRNGDGLREDSQGRALRCQ